MSGHLRAGSATRRRFLTTVASAHEVMEDWWPGETFDHRGYEMKNTLLLAALGSRAFHEFMPLRFTPSEPGRVYRKISYGPLLDLFMLDMRSYRGPSKAPHDIHYGPDAYLLGPAQLAWFKRELKRSPQAGRSSRPTLRWVPLLPARPTPAQRLVAASRSQNC